MYILADHLSRGLGPGGGGWNCIHFLGIYTRPSASKPLCPEGWYNKYLVLVAYSTLYSPLTVASVVAHKSDYRCFTIELSAFIY